MDLPKKSDSRSDAEVLPNLDVDGVVCRSLSETPSTTYIQKITEDYVQNHDEYLQFLKDYISQDYKISAVQLEASETAIAPRNLQKERMTVLERQGAKDLLNHEGQLKHIDDVYQLVNDPDFEYHSGSIVNWPGIGDLDAGVKKKDISSYLLGDVRKGSTGLIEDKLSRFLFYLLRKVDELESKVNKQDNKLRSKSKIKAIKKEADILQSMMHGEKKKTKKRSKKPKRSTCS